MAAVSLFWDHNMVTVTSCENALYTGNELQATLKRGEKRDAGGSPRPCICIYPSPITHDFLSSLRPIYPNGKPFHRLTHRERKP